MNIDRTLSNLLEHPPLRSTLARLGARQLTALMLCVTAATTAATMAPRDVFAADWIYTVRPGDSLWSITNDYLEGVGYFNQLRTYNNLTGNDKVRAGSRLKIPVDWLKAQPAGVAISRVRGTVEKIARGSGDVSPAAVGDQLELGDGIRTGEGGSAVLVFADASSMYLRPSTSITFDSLGAYGETGMTDTSMRLHSGRIDTDVTPARGAASRFEITTPSAVAAVRGTDFRAAYDPEQTTGRVEVAEGNVAVLGETDEASLDAGFGIVASVGQPLPPPVELLPAPDLSGLSTLVERELWQLEWPPLSGASAYRILLFASGSLDAPLISQRTTEARAELNAPPDGDYALKIRGIDAQALEGLDSELDVTINARPVPPPPLRPAQDAKVPGPPPEFGWAMPSTTDSVRLQIARDEAFTDIVVDVDGLDDVAFKPEGALEPGDYYWRLASRGEDGDGPFGDAVALRMQALPPTPAPAQTEVAGRDAKLTWGRLANTVAYEFELADEETFADPLIRETLDKPEFIWKSPGPGTFYFRARGVSDEGVKGPWGPDNRLEMPYLNVPANLRDPAHI